MMAMQYGLVRLVRHSILSPGSNTPRWPSSIWLSPPEVGELTRAKPPYRVSLPVESSLLTSHLSRRHFSDSIFYDDQTHILFATYKYVGHAYADDMERMRENPKVREWWKMTDAFQESMVDGAKDSESGEPSWWKPLEEVFYQA